MKNKSLFYRPVILLLALIFIFGIGYQILLKSKMKLADERYNRIQDYVSLFNEMAAIEFGFFYEKDLMYQERFKKVQEKFVAYQSVPIHSHILFFHVEYSDKDKETLFTYTKFAESYIGLLSNIFANQIALGLDHNKGYYGLLRDHAHAFENIVNKYNDDRLMAHVLMMRRHEKDFMLRGLEKYVTQYQQEYKLLTNMVKNSNYKEREQLQSSLDKYVETFHKYVFYSQEIGENHLQGFTFQTKMLRNDFQKMSKVELDQYRVVYVPLEERFDSIMFMNIITFMVIVIIFLMLNREVSYAQERNPLTGLNGNRRIEQYLKQICHFATKRVVIYFDFDNFKPFNDRFGFKDGDEAIAQFAVLLKETFGVKGHFIGHIGGDDFIVIENRSDFDKSIRKIKKIQQKFEEFTLKYYSPEEAQQGFMLQKDRFGIERQTPLLSASAAVVYLDSHVKVNSPDIISEEISKIKKLSKENKVAAISIYGKLPPEQSAMIEVPSESNS